VVAATVVLPDKLAGQAHRRGTVRVPEATKIEVMDTYCCQCMRSYDDVIETPCIAATDRDHLIGGPTGERKKRSKVNLRVG
jgi:hypothetical protein